jgi:segregation and condensation protein B
MTTSQPSPKSILESLLFASAEPITFDRLASLMDMTRDAVEKVVADLQFDYSFAGSSRGIALVRDADNVQMVTAKNCSSYVEKLGNARVQEKLSDASIETLAILAYRGSLTRAELEDIRGVNTAIILRNLLIRGLIQKSYDKERAAQVYSVTLDFLRSIGQDNVTRLPDYKHLHVADLSSSD